MRVPIRDSRIFLLFFMSGISGLLYEVVWLRMLARILGVTIFATATVIAAFMAGLALGSFLLGRRIDRHRQPLRIYALLELGIGVAALVITLALQASVPLYRTLAEVAGPAAPAKNGANSTSCNRMPSRSAAPWTRRATRCWSWPSPSCWRTARWSATSCA